MAALASGVAGLAQAPQGRRRARIAMVGTGWRGSLTWGKELAENYSDVAEIVGLCDINGKRAEASRKIIGSSAPTFVDFDRMLEQTRPDCVLVTTVDSTHYRYVVRALELNCDVICEKPLCTDESQAQAILDAAARSKKKITIGFNARHDPMDKRVKQLMMEKAVGDVLSVEFNEYLDTDHGASYFRRWHRLKQNSGTLLVHKASHHFDQVDWWIDSAPVEVTASGELRFYGRNNAFRGTHCRACPFKNQCKFYWDITRDERAMRLYADCESEDGYLRDGCVWAEEINIYDSMSVLVKYENGARLTWTGHAYLPLEGQAISINGTQGRIDYATFSGGGIERRELRLTRSFGKSEVIEDLEPELAGGHGGADTSLMNSIFRETDKPDPLGLRADLRGGVLASLTGIAAYRSIERGGEKIRIAELVKI
ncbi:MAG: Gfo/Idh/MocA family oxidoreductase [Acidobacteria bacterium]|nr:Gfo/Idh/MocA family oxidoreductase [Acidobacteriota bacterium]